MHYSLQSNRYQRNDSHYWGVPGTRPPETLTRLHVLPRRLSSFSSMSFFAGPTPSPSPPSSPCSAFIDSSPPVSRPSTPPSFASYVQSSPVHPFSASTNQAKLPPRYEKRLVTPPITPESDRKGLFFRPNLPQKRFLNTYEDDAYLNDFRDTDSRSARPRNAVVTSEDQEREIWEEKMEAALQAVDMPIVEINLR